MQYNRSISLFLIIFILSTTTSCSLFRSAKVQDAEEDDAPKGTVEVGSLQPANKYYEVISEDVESEEGLFTTHIDDGKLYFEIPDSLLGKEILLVSRIARAQQGTGYGGTRLANRVLRWEKNGDKILLRNVIYQSVADTSSAIYHAVRNATFEPIIAAFDIETRGPEHITSVIDVTSLFTTDVPELSPRERYSGRRVDQDRSYIDSARSFPENVEIRNVITLQADRVPAGGNIRTISLLLNHSFFKLPEIPMQPRLHDERVGYFSVRQTDYSMSSHGSEQRRFITRWRLEKKDPEAEISEPVKPIVFYVDPGTPEYLVDYVIQGVNDWQPAFEQAGFKNAIIGKKAPVDDSDFSMEDARYSMIRWLPSTTMNAHGPHVHDPRSGEIITSSIGMFHNVKKLLRNWHFVQTAAVDERAQNLPFPDSLMGRLVQMVVAHEVGHTLGLPHNMKASGTVPVDSLRSPTFTKKYGTTPSIMDYARMNYVAQPGDGAYLFPIVSIYDHFAIEWGYTPFPEASTPEKERPFLEQITRRQDDEPMLRFGHLSVLDPTRQREALSDDHVRATQYGIANQKRIMEFIVDAAGNEGDTYEALGELYQSLIQQRNWMLGHVVTWVGGIYGDNKVYGQEGTRFRPVERERQVEALNYLLQEAFQTPDYLLDPDVLERIQATGAVNMIKQSQRRILYNLMGSTRLNRMAELEASYSSDRILPVDEMMTEIRASVWKELHQPQVEIDLFRRNLQRNYLEVISVHGSRSFLQSTSEGASLLRGHLRLLASDIEQAIPKTADQPTRFHLEDLLELTREILEP
ncbi:zinc-dependent metalloprotease [Balneolaceae bacterium ANBcel3]|nr:zinc-dependent metalloprotease [Balneolaceae bacterium ANBcel3]